MATYLYSQLANNAILNFAGGDTLRFDGTGLSAADLQVVPTSDGRSLNFTLAGKAFVLQGTSSFDLNPSALLFDNGSQVAKSAWFWGQPLSLATGAGNDLLIGSPVAKPLYSFTPNLGGTLLSMSADGSFLGYSGERAVGSSYANFGTWTMNLDTGQEIEHLYYGDNGGAWKTLVSVDGSWVIASSVIAPSIYPGSTPPNSIFAYNTLTTETKLVSASANGAAFQTDGLLDISADGRYVAFNSRENIGLVSDTNGLADIFVKDIITGSVISASSWSGGPLANGASGGARMDLHGRWLAFDSAATNLGAGADSNGIADVYLRDLPTGDLFRVSNGLAGTQSNGASQVLGISQNGARVLFLSSASNLVTGDTNAQPDLFVWDRSTGITTRVNLRSDGMQANDAALADAAISANGVYVVFSSKATNLAEIVGPVGYSNIYVKNLNTGESACLSLPVNTSGVDGDSYSVDISADGSRISFVSASARLLPSDTNGKIDLFVVDNPLIGMTLVGGAGNDRYLVGSSRDVVVEYSGGGTDTVVSTASYTLPANVESLKLAGSGNNIHGTGNSLNNWLAGNAGTNWLDGMGGTDTVNYSDATGPVTVSLHDPDALIGFARGSGVGNDSLVNIENVLGSRYNDTVSGAAGRNWLDGGAGNDTLSYYNASAGVAVNLALTAAQNTGGAGTDTVLHFEHLIGSAFNDTLTGNTASNSLQGANGSDSLVGDLGNDTLDGGLGNDTMAGGAGNDIYQVTDMGDVVLEEAASGIDTVYSSLFSYTLPDNVENLSGNGGQTLIGNALANILTGDPGSNNVLDGGAGVDTASYANAWNQVTVDLSLSGMQYTFGAASDTLISIENVIGSTYNDTLTGNAGANRLDGGAGADTLIGGAGNDIYIVDNVGDITVDGVGGGYDAVLSSITWTLPSSTASLLVYPYVETRIENLQLTGSRAINGTGNELANRLVGNGADNVLNGLGGNDTLDGGLGNDTASYASAASAVAVSLALSGGAQDTGGAGLDTLISIERLTGSAWNDQLTGDAGNNLINGGNGADTMAGGLGNDIYLISSYASDVVIESAGGGVDTVSFANATSLFGLTVSLNDAAYAEIENLTGSANNDWLEGDNGANLLNGLGGNDSLVGGAGNDTYILSDTYSDVVTELDGGGTDTISFAAATSEYGVNAYVSNYYGIESLAGSNYNDTLTGNDGANVLSGGLGNDFLTGGQGGDSFIFNTALNAGTNLDTITDFVSGTDKIKLDDAVCSAIGNLGNFVAGDARFHAAAGVVAGHDLDDRVIYNTTTGALYYDADGSGAVAAIQIALLGASTHPGLAATDCMVI